MNQPSKNRTTGDFDSAVAVAHTENEFYIACFDSEDEHPDTGFLVRYLPVVEREFPGLFLYLQELDRYAPNEFTLTHVVRNNHPDVDYFKQLGYLDGEDDTDFLLRELSFDEADTRLDEAYSAVSDTTRTRDMDALAEMARKQLDTGVATETFIGQAGDYAYLVLDAKKLTRLGRPLERLHVVTREDGRLTVTERPVESLNEDIT